MRRFEVRMTADAVGDLEEIVDWIARHDGPDRAQQVLDRIQAAVDALKRFPERGTYPAELVALGIREYRETFFKPYRIVYHVEGARVFISLIADGRRDMQSLLARRLFAG
ncbi:MAG: plasmid stabilization protein [Geminicoccaceae bacterium]|nr:plasmid stabilization protein [Geminicoccaceae bacterium]